MRLLEAKPDISQRELAEHLGISLGGLNYCLRALADKGLVKMQNFTENPNKLGYVYLLTPKGMAAKAQLASGFLKRKMAEYDALKAEIESLRSELSSTNADSQRSHSPHRPHPPT